MIELPVPGDLHLEPFGQRIDALRSNSVQSAGIFIGSLIELSSCMKVRKNQLHRRHLELRMHVDGDTAAVIGNTDRSVDVDGDFDMFAVTRQMFVDRVI